MNNSLLPISFKLQANSLQRGFTLIELMIYMGLLSIFLFVMTDLLASTLDIRANSTSNSAVVLEAEYLRRRLEYDVHRSTAISAPSTGASGSTVSLTIGGSTYSYASSSGSLVLTTGGVSYPLTNDAVQLTSFSVSRVGNGNANDTLRFAFTLDSTTQLRGVPAESRSEVFTTGAW